jgi:hypothetical protein
MTTIRPEIRARFRRVVARAIERSDREHAAHLARLRGSTTERRDWTLKRRAPKEDVDTE